MATYVLILINTANDTLSKKRHLEREISRLDLRNTYTRKLLYQLLPDVNPGDLPAISYATYSDFSHLTSKFDLKESSMSFTPSI